MKNIELKLENEPIATAVLNLDIFKSAMVKEFDFVKAVMNNLKVTKNIECDTETVKKTIFYGTEWGLFLHMMSEVVNSGNVIFRVYKAETFGRTALLPNKIDTGSGVMSLKEEERDGVIFVVTNELCPRIDRSVEFALSRDLIDYVSYDWNVVVDFNGPETNAN